MKCSNAIAKIYLAGTIRLATLGSEVVELTNQIFEMLTAFFLAVPAIYAAFEFLKKGDFRPGLEFGSIR